MAVRPALGAAAVAAATLLAPSPASADPPPPESFYTPPDVLPGRHGALIRHRKLRNDAAIKGADDRLVLYRSTTAAGQPVAVSGIVSVPRGTPPQGGWPVVSWAHGTTGIADKCAPSVSPEKSPVSRYPQVLLRPWIKAGYAVVRTDYQGLGTPGVHQYLVGRSEGRAVLDIVRAARQLDPVVSRRVVLAGHSQGGHAALWAAKQAPSWTPGLKVRGTVAVAPASHIETQAKYVKALTEPGELSSLAGLIMRGLDAARPGLEVRSYLSTPARALYPETKRKCLAGLYAKRSWGGLAPAELFRPRADLTILERALGKSDPEHLTVTKHVLVIQGLADDIVFPVFTQDLVDSYRDRGVRVRLNTYPGAGHSEVLPVAAGDINAWIASRLER